MTEATATGLWSRDVPSAVFSRIARHYGFTLDPSAELDGYPLWVPVGGGPAHVANRDGLIMVWRKDAPCTIAADFQHPVRQLIVTTFVDLLETRVVLTDDDFSHLVQTAVLTAGLHEADSLDGEDLDMVRDRVFGLIPEDPASGEAVLTVDQAVRLIAVAANRKLRKQKQS